MTRSKHYGEVKEWFKNGFWDERRVRLAVNRWITVAEYKDITGKTY